MKKSTIAIVLCLAASSVFAGQRGGMGMGMGTTGAAGTTGSRTGTNTQETQLTQLTQQETQLNQEIKLIDQVLQAVLAGNPASATEEANKQLEEANAQVKQRQAEYNAARNIGPNAEREYQETKAKLLKEIQENRPEYKQAAESEAAAKAKLDAANQACIAQLAKTTSYQKAKKIATADEAKVKALRETGDPDELATASEKWMESSSNLKEIENKATSADPKSIAAQRVYNDAHMAVVSLNAQFEKELASNGELVAIKIKTADASKQIDAAKTELSKATTQRDQLQKQVAQMNTYINNPTNARTTMINKQQQLTNITSQIQQIKARSNPGGVNPVNPDPILIVPVGPNTGMPINPNDPNVPMIIIPGPGNM